MMRTLIATPSLQWLAEQHRDHRQTFLHFGSEHSRLRGGLGWIVRYSTEFSLVFVVVLVVLFCLVFDLFFKSVVDKSIS